jgi:hypothetical protein
MTPRAQSILEQLEGVAAERARRAADPVLVARTAELKHYQQRRFAKTYADLLASARYAAASRFFLEELYGPRDFTERDAQFARVVPALVRLFPSELVDTVAELASLHALTERLDSAMAAALDSAPIDARAYAAAWRTTGEPALREQQVALTVAIGTSLDRLTRKPLLRGTLHLMRGPARAAGLGALQAFLESGFDTFKTMNGADEFLETVAARERALASALSGPDGSAALLGQLP